MGRLSEWAQVVAFTVFTAAILVLILRGIAPREWLFYPVCILVPSPTQHGVMRAILGAVLQPGATLTIPPPPGVPHLNTRPPPSDPTRGA